MYRAAIDVDRSYTCGRRDGNCVLIIVVFVSQMVNDSAKEE
jgi:hypothetical protein